MIEMDVNLEELDGAAEAFRRAPERVREFLRDAMYESGLEVLKAAKDRVHVISGALRRAITTSGVESIGSGFRVRIGAKLPYARIEEEGFTGEENVRQHSRRVKSRNVYASSKAQVASGIRGGKDVYRSRRSKVAQGIAYVRAHSRRVNRPGHPYLSTALENSGETVRTIHRDAMNDAVAEVLK